MTREEVVINIRATYSRYGVTDAEIEEHISSGEAKGFSYQAIYTGLRMALGKAYNVEELFTVEEVAEAMGASREEVITEIECARAEAEAMGNDADEVAYKTEQGEVTRFIIPAGFLS